MSEAEATVTIDTSYWETLCEQLGAFSERLSAYLDDAFERLIAAWAPVSAYLQELYTAVGAPYGDSDEGLRRWLEEAGEARRLRAQAEAIEQRWRDQADLREWGREMRARRRERREARGV